MATINYTVGDNWGSGFVGNIKVPGGTSGLHGWTLEFDATFDISNIWGAEIVSHVGNHYVIRNVAWTADVPAGGQASFGFEAKPGSGGTTASGLHPERHGRHAHAAAGRRSDHFHRRRLDHRR